MNERKKPMNFHRARVNLVFADIAREIIRIAYHEGYYIGGTGQYIPLNLEGVGRRWGHSVWRNAISGDREAKRKLMRYQEKAQNFFDASK